MSLEDWRQVFAAVGIILILGMSTPLISRFMPSSSENFTAMAILGENGIAEKYYPNEDANIPLGQPVKWHLYLYNHEEGASYLLVRVKILDFDSTPPNSTYCTPSPSPDVYEFRRILENNETVIIPFEWSILDAENSSGRILIKRISINNHQLYPSLSLDSGMLRFVFELWVYDEASNRFRFDLGNGSRCVWNQIWFNLTLSA